MVLGKRWLFSFGKGAEIRLLEKGRKSPGMAEYILIKVCLLHILIFSGQWYAKQGSFAEKFDRQPRLPSAPSLSE